MQERKTVKNNLISPLKDKTKLMKIEHLLSNNYVLGFLIGGIDLAIFMVANLVTNFFFQIPALLLQKVSSDEFFSFRLLLPRRFSLASGIALLLILAVVDVVLIYRIKVSWSEDYFNVGQKGTRRFLTEEEIKEEYQAIDMLNTPYPGDPGIPIARIGNQFYIDTNVVNNLILGLTRGGKGEMMVRPSIEIYSRAENQPSLIVNDKKLELYKTFTPVLKKRGYEVHLLNNSNPKLSMGFNLVTVALDFYKKKDYDTAEMVVNSLAYAWFETEKARGDMLFFTNSAASLFSAMVLATMEDALAEDKYENQKRYDEWKRMSEADRKAHPFVNRTDNEKCVNLYSMIVNFGQLVEKPITKDGSKTMVDKYFEGRPATDRAKLKFLGTKVAPDKTKSGVFSEMLRELDTFILYNVARMTAESTLDLADLGFGEKPIAVFIGTPSYDSSLDKIAVFFIRQMYYVLGKMCDDGKGKCDRQVKVIMDECGNMPEIDHLKTMITMGLGQNISFDLYMQNYKQVDDIYGEKVAETIKGNCGNHIFIQTNANETAEEYSKRLGDKSVIDLQRAGGKLSWNKYFTESVQDKPLLRPTDLMDLQKGEFVVARSSKREDNDGNRIKPRPIFNSVESGRYFPYAYTYFTEEFRSPNEVNFLDICEESREHIEPDQRIWDIRKSFEQMKRKNQKIQMLKDIGYADLAPLLEKSFGVHYETKYGINKDTTIAELADFIERQEIPEVEREAIRNFLI